MKSKTFDSTKSSSSKVPTKRIVEFEEPIGVEKVAKKVRRPILGIQRLTPTRGGGYFITDSEAKDGQLFIPKWPDSSRLGKKASSEFFKLKSYPFDAIPSSLTIGQKVLYDSLIEKGKKPKAQLSPNLDALQNLGILDELKSKFEASGLSLLFKEDYDYGMFDELVMEFLVSFEPDISTSPYHVKSVNAWKFRLGGITWDIDSLALNECFGFPESGKFAMFNNGDIEAFWTKISGLNGLSCSQSSNNIKDPLWRLTHRLLGGNILYRQDLGYYVKKSDLKIMMLMDEGDEVDWLWYITESLLDGKKTCSKNLAIGGGSFLSYLAKQLGFTFGSRKGAKDRLTKERMISMSILGKGGLWKVKEEVPPLVEEKPIIDEKPSLPIPPSFHTSPQVLNVLQEILTKLDALTQSHNNFVSLVTSHLGIETGGSSSIPSVPVDDGVDKSLEGEGDTIDEGAELGDKSA